MAQGVDGWIAEVGGFKISMIVDILGRVWEIPIRGMIADSLGDRAANFRCILEQDDVRGVSTMVAN